MASLTSFSQSHSLFKKPYFAITSLSSSSWIIPKDLPCTKGQCCKLPPRMARINVVISATVARKSYPGETEGFVEEMKFVAMKFHSTEQSKEGEKEVTELEDRSLEKWEPSVDGYLKFLVNSKLVHDTLEGIIHQAAFPIYAEFRNTGLERSEKLAKDLQWFKEQGYNIPEPSSAGITYAEYLKKLSEQDHRAFICHYYNIYFAHAAGGRMIGKKVAEKIVEEKEFEFYKWDGELSQLLQNVKDKLNAAAEEILTLFCFHIFILCT